MTSSTGPEGAAAGWERAADRPLADPSADRLGYAPFARALATGVSEINNPDGVVVAVNGAWGLGKTTVLNFVEHYLREIEPNDFVFLRFNPWWFSGRVDLALAFLSELRSAVSRLPAVAGEIKKHLLTLSQIAGSIPYASEWGKAAERLLSRQSDVASVKAKIADALASQEKRIVIMVDDIDRLTRDEVSELFGVIKALADFPNTVYVLAFDDERVARQLGGHFGESGRDYLEKVVQLPFHLPPPDRGGIRELFIGQLNEILGEELDEDLFDPEEWSSTFSFGLDGLLQTPRDVIRLTNALRVTYGAVRGEVNVVDFIVIEALRVFEPTVYDRVRARPDLFGVLTGIARAFPQTRDEEQKEYHLAWVELISDGKRRESVKHLVARLFPEAAKALDVAIPVSRRRIDARRARAVSEPDYFQLYFRFALGEDVISRELVAGLLQTASDAEAFGKALLELAEQKTPAGRTRASVMLDELNAQAERGFAEADIPDVIKSLTSIGDKLWIESDDEFLGADNPSRIIWLIGGLLDRTPKENRCDILEAAINQAESIATPVLLVRRVIRSLGEATRESTQTAAPENLDEAHGIVSIECAKRLERLAADKVSTAANAGELWGLPRFLYVVAEWNRWGDGEAVRSWVSKVLANDDELARLLISSRSERKTTKGLRHRLDPRWFDDYAQRDQVAASVRRLRASASDSDAADACDQYLTELQMLDEGKDPEVRFDWD